MSEGTTSRRQTDGFIPSSWTLSRWTEGARRAELCWTVMS